jgi:hypothetical protein
MFIAKVLNNEIGEVVDYRTVFTHGLSVSDEQLTVHGYVKVNLHRDHDRLTQKLISSTPVLENGWVYTVAVADLTAEEVQSAKDSAMANIRAQRNDLLKACDWTQIADCTADKTAWATYRTALRNLPATITGDPRTFSDWPHDPNWVDRTI